MYTKTKISLFILMAATQLSSIPSFGYFSGCMPMPMPYSYPTGVMQPSFPFSAPYLNPMIPRPGVSSYSSYQDHSFLTEEEIISNQLTSINSRGIRQVGAYSAPPIGMDAIMNHYESDRLLDSYRARKAWLDRVSDSNLAY
jgi:hypothetical protein